MPQTLCRGMLILRGKKILAQFNFIQFYSLILSLDHKINIPMCVCTQKYTTGLYTIYFKGKLVLPPRYSQSSFCISPF